MRPHTWVTLSESATLLCWQLFEQYQKRFLRYREKLFTFLDYDSIPWNNNNAEHAVKQFAYYRTVADGRMTEAGLNDYLVWRSCGSVPWLAGN